MNMIPLQDGTKRLKMHARKKVEKANKQCMIVRFIWRTIAQSSYDL